MAAAGTRKGNSGGRILRSDELRVRETLARPAGLVEDSTGSSDGKPDMLDPDCWECFSVLRREEAD